MAGLVQDNFLIVADMSTLYQLDLVNGSAVKIHEDPEGRIRKVVFDPVEKKMYWLNAMQHIRRANLNGTDNETIYTGDVYMFDVDPVSRLVYYTPYWPYVSETYVMTLDGRHHIMIIPKRRRFSIVLHPTRG